MFTHASQEQGSLLQQALGSKSRVKGSSDTFRRAKCKSRGPEGLTVKGEVTDESGWLVAAGKLQERQQLCPELPQIAVLLPSSNSWNSYERRVSR